MIQIKWLNPVANRFAQSGMMIVPAGNYLFTPPFRGGAVLYLRIAADSAS
jgi:hypothetical protein